jgi:Trypsin
MKQLLIICCVFASAQSNGELYPQLIGGTSTFIQNHPYMAAVYSKEFYTCSGTIINYRSILTVINEIFNLKFFF